MSFDFFGEGIKEETTIKFTKQQDLFFQSKLPFLDPDGKKVIPLGQAISLLKFSGLPPNMQKKILTNLKMTGKGTLDYTDMKKILRGVALAQNRIQPSTININANIKTKLPVFQDDSDEQQEQQHEHTQNPPPKVVQKQPPPARPPVQTQEAQKPRQQNVPQHQPPRPSQNANLPPSSVPHSPITQKNESKPSEDNFSQSLKKFDSYWQTLSTQQGQKISGNEVKKLFGKSENRKQLSKIWKICAVTHKGYLTKGQLYVFIQLMKLKSGSVPNSLTNQMKEIIHKIDHLNGHKKTTETNLGHSQLGFSQFQIDKSQALDKSHHQRAPEKKPSNAGNFGNFAEFSNPTSPTTNISKQQQSPRTPTLQKIEIPQPPAQIHQIPQDTIQQIHASSLKQIQFLATTIIPQLQTLSQQNKKSSTVLNEVNQFMNGIQQGQSMVMSKIAEIKSTQDDLNHRLNMTCIRMRDVIQRQSDIIKDLKQTMDGEVQFNVERVGVLETYAGNVENQLAQQAMNSRRKSVQSSNNEGNQQAYHGSSDTSNAPSGIYNKKSMQSMREMSMSMSVVNRNNGKGSSTNVAPRNNKNTYESNDSSDVVPQGGIYRQKLFEQLRQQQYHNDGNSGDEDEEEEDSPPTKVSIQSNKKEEFVFKKTEQVDIEEPSERKKTVEDNEEVNQHKFEYHGEQAHSDHPKIEEQQKVDDNLSEKQKSESFEEDEAAKRIYMKRVYTIQMVNFLAPIQQNQYAVVVQKVQAMTEGQLDVLYANLYPKYQAKIEAEAKNKQEQAPEPAKNLPTYDEFSSNNFKNVTQPTQANKDDFFG